MATSSTVARWELAHRIKVRRNELGISVEQIAKHLGFTRNFFSAVEHERSMLATDKLEVLLVMLEFDDEERKEMMELDEHARDRGWWESKDVVEQFGELGSRFMGLEQGASVVRTYDSLAIPGLLQAPDYTRALLESDPHISSMRLADFERARARRQSEISARVPIVALFSEAALNQHWGPSDLLSKQLSYVLECVQNFANLQLRILTFHSPPGVLATSSTLSLLDFESPHLPGVCFQEAVRELDLITSDNPQYQRVYIAYERALGKAKSHEDSVAFIRRML